MNPADVVFKVLNLDPLPLATDHFQGKTLAIFIFDTIIAPGSGADVDLFAVNTEHFRPGVPDHEDQDQGQAGDDGFSFKTHE